MACSLESVGVIRLANCYIATHFQGKQKTFVSNHPETDIKIAQATAHRFAKENNIAYDNTLQEPTQPIITVIKDGDTWYPAELHADKITLITHFGPMSLGGTQQQATNMANIIALSRLADCIPSIGISLER